MVPAKWPRRGQRGVWGDPLRIPAEAGTDHHGGLPELPTTPQALPNCIYMRLVRNHVHNVHGIRERVHRSVKGRLLPADSVCKL
jgi:hypothetical protein